MTDNRDRIAPSEGRATGSAFQSLDWRDGHLMRRHGLAEGDRRHGPFPRCQAPPMLIGRAGLTSLFARPTRRRFGLAGKPGRPHFNRGGRPRRFRHASPKRSKLGGQVARDLHADAHFDDNRCRPGHISLPYRVELGSPPTAFAQHILAASASQADSYDDPISDMLRAAPSG
jgi:hypothetical protein